MPDRVPLRDVDLRQVDLNLLVPLGVLLRHQHLSRAARELGLSQPAMSRALGRLRELFDDELLVPAGGSLRLTPRAQALRPVLERALGQVMQLFDDAPFDPASATGEVCIAMVDVLAYKLLPHLLAVFDRRAPSLRLRVRDWEADFHSHLARGEVELTFGHPRGNEPGIYQQKLISVDWACVLRRANQALQQAWDLDTFCGLKHALVTTEVISYDEDDNELIRNEITSLIRGAGGWDCPGRARGRGRVRAAAEAVPKADHRVSGRSVALSRHCEGYRSSAPSCSFGRRQNRSR